MVQADLLTSTAGYPDAMRQHGANSEAQRRRAEVYIANGDYDTAIHQLDRLVALERKAGDRTGEGWALSSLGAAYLVAGQLEAAEQRLGQAERLARASRDNRLLGAVLQNRVNLLTRQRRQAEARSVYREVLDLSRNQVDDALMGRAYLVAARVEKDAGNPKRMRSLLNDGYEVLLKQPESIEKAAGLINVARILGIDSSTANLSQSDLALLTKVLEEALTVSDSLRKPYFSAYAAGYLGRVYEIRRRTSEALKLTAQAIMFAQQISADDLLYTWEWQVGRLYAAKGRPRKAIAAYRRAEAALEKIRPQLFARAQEGEVSYRDLVSPFYQQLADLLLTHTGPVMLSRTDADRLRDARDAIESLRTVELQDYFLDECVAEAQSRAIGVELAAARRANTDTVAVLYPILFEDRAELIATLPDGTLRQRTISIDARTISSTVRRLREGLDPVVDQQTGEVFTPPVPALLKPAQRLHRWFIAPIESDLKRQQVDTLVVVPDTDLLTVPFGVFHDGRKYLVQDYAIATTPGLTLTEARPLSRWQLRGLLAGLTTDPLIGEGVALELNTIERILGESSVTSIANRDFSVPQLRKVLNRSPYSVVHFSTHAVFGGTPDTSYITTYSGRLSIDQLEELMQLRRYSDEPVDLLVLSGCETARGNTRAALGLSGLAIKAGARSAVGALWVADSLAAADIFRAFYEALMESPSISKAKALQKAQKRMIELSPREDDDHPTVWGPFVLIGNWL